MQMVMDISHDTGTVVQDIKISFWGQEVWVDPLYSKKDKRANDIKTRPRKDKSEHLNSLVSTLCYAGILCLGWHKILS